MKIDAKITFLVNPEYTSIEAYDQDSKITFVKIRLTPEQLSSALSRLSYTKCESVEVRDLDRVGKIKEQKTIVFELPSDINPYFSEDEWEKLREYAQTKLDDGWIAGNYFGSQDSSFWKYGKQYIKCAAARWLNKIKT